MHHRSDEVLRQGMMNHVEKSCSCSVHHILCTCTAGKSGLLQLKEENQLLLSRDGPRLCNYSAKHFSIRYNLHCDGSGYDVLQVTFQVFKAASCNDIQS